MLKLPPTISVAASELEVPLYKKPKSPSPTVKLPVTLSVESP